MSRSNQQYLEIFLHDRPLMDVRAPVEFAKGAFPLSTNLPLLDDEQRQQIGTRYRELGQQAALELGWQLLTPELKQARQQQWREFIDKHPQGYLYCFRGGLRSKITQQLVAEGGVDYPRIEGGYKAMRRFLLESLQQLSSSTELIIVSGRTCSGKTLVLENLSTAIDLEALARHRGSAFGAGRTAQPTQINFENALAIQLLKHHHLQSGPLILEDEGRLIGRCALPLELRRRMRSAKRVVVHTPLEQRVEMALQDYVIDNLLSLQACHGREEGIDQLAHFIQSNLARIQKRLGGDRYSVLRTLAEDAVKLLRAKEDIGGFKPIIHLLLVDYYDPMYDFQSRQHAGPVVFNGDRHSVRNWLGDYANSLRTNQNLAQDGA